MKQRSIRHLLLPLLLVAALILAACGGGAQPGGSDAPAPDSSGTGGQTAPAEKKTLVIGYGGGEPDAGDVADYLGFDHLKDRYEIKFQPLGEDSAAIASVASGRVDIVNIDLTDAIQATQTGVPVKILTASNTKQEFIIAGKPEIKSLQDLKGKKFAYHNPGSTTEYYAFTAVEKIAGLERTDVNWMALPGSSNRVKALVAGQIDATVVEWPDWLELKEQGEYNLLSSFNDIAPDAIATVFATTEKWFAAHPQEAQDFIDALVAGYRQAYDDKEAFVAKAGALLPQLEADRIANTYDFYAEIGMFPKADTLSEAGWTATDKYYREEGKEYEQPAPYSMVAADMLSTAWGK